MLRFFKSNHPVIKIVIGLLNLLLWVPKSFFDFEPEIQPLWPFFEFINTPLGNSLTVATLVTVCALGLNYLVDSLEFELRASHIPAFCFSIFCSILLFDHGFHIVLLALLPLLISIHILLGVFRESRAFPKYFEAGIWLGLAVIAYQPFIILVPFYVLIISYTRTFNWRELLLPVIASVLPAAILIQVGFLVTGKFKFDNLFQLAWNLQWDPNVVQWTALSCWTLLLLFSLQKFWMSFVKSTNRSKNTKNGFFILSIGLLVSTGLLQIAGAFVAIIPFSIALSMFYTYIFSSSHKRIWEMCFSLLFLLPLLLLVLDKLL